MDFSNDIREYIIAAFSTLGIDYSLGNDLDLDLLNLFTVQKKVVWPQKRTVSYSRAVLDKINTLSKSETDAIRHIEDLLSKGKDVNAFQTKNVFNYRVHDQLVYAWKIYHFHLSTARAKDRYFNDRTKRVIFAYIKDDRVLFLNVDKHPPHDVFADIELLEILDIHWPEVLVPVNGIVGLEHSLNRKERFQLRKFGANEGIIEVNGKFVFQPGLGCATSGHSSEASMMLIDFKRWIRMNMDVIETNQLVLNRYFKDVQGISEPIEYGLVFSEDGPVIHEKNSGTIVVRNGQFLQPDKLNQLLAEHG